MRLGLVLATDLEADRGLCQRLARAALAAGHEVRLFLMHEGIAFATRPELAELCEAGVEAVACGTNALQRGLDLLALPGGGVAEGSQLDHARLVRECDRVVTLA
jgi:sulfur relay (sulfurtransferase) complex TusBCD TusD component (DsrE family)